MIEYTMVVLDVQLISGIVIDSLPYAYHTKQRTKVGNHTTTQLTAVSSQWHDMMLMKHFQNETGLSNFTSVLCGN